MPNAQTDLDELLKSYRGWLVTVARKLVKDEHSVSWEDLAQEGHIAMWRAYKDWDGRGTVDGWMKFKGYRAMLTTLRPRKMSERAADGESPVWDGFNHSDNLEAVETGYHNGEILAAINELTPKQREYVYRRFYLGETYSEMQAAMHTPNPGSMWFAKPYGAKTRLAKALAHLADASV